jgi:hypothetical protein
MEMQMDWEESLPTVLKTPCKWETQLVDHQESYEDMIQKKHSEYKNPHELPMATEDMNTVLMSKLELEKRLFTSMFQGTNEEIADQRSDIFALHQKRITEKSRYIFADLTHAYVLQYEDIYGSYRVSHLALQLFYTLFLQRSC